MTLSQVALTTTIIFMILFAAAAIFGNRGYGFDLRRKGGDRRKDPKRAGGRRESDARAAA